MSSRTYLKKLIIIEIIIEYCYFNDKSEISLLTKLCGDFFSRLSNK